MYDNPGRTKNKPPKPSISRVFLTSPFPDEIDVDDEEPTIK